MNTIILRHRRENLKKCSLRGLESRPDIDFYTYPKHQLPDLTGAVMLDFEGPTLSEADRDQPLFIIDGTWALAEKMSGQVPALPKRSLPSHFRTAYPRKQTGCADPECGLASVEALYIAYYLMGRDTTGLLDHYYWKEPFLTLNHSHFLKHKVAS